MNRVAAWRRVLFVIVLIPLGAVAVALSVANRERVTLPLDPFDTRGSGVERDAAAVRAPVRGAGGRRNYRRGRRVARPEQVALAARMEREQAARLRREVERTRQLAGKTPAPPPRSRRGLR